MTKLTEEQARQMPAEPELDRFCAEWMGWDLLSVEGDNEIWHHRGQNDTRVEGELPPFSSDWSAAGPLLEAMKNLQADGYSFTGAALEYCPHVLVDKVWRIGVITYDGLKTFVKAPTPQLAIARACAVLVAREISRDELEN